MISLVSWSTYEQWRNPHLFKIYFVTAGAGGNHIATDLNWLHLKLIYSANEKKNNCVNISVQTQIYATQMPSLLALISFSWGVSPSKLNISLLPANCERHLSMSSVQISHFSCKNEWVNLDISVKMEVLWFCGISCGLCVGLGVFASA